MRPLSFREAPKREALRVRRRPTRAITLLVFVVFIAAAAYGVSALSYLPQFSIERIEVSGVNGVRPALVKAFVATKLWDGSPGFFSESNIFVYPRVGIETALKEFFPRVESARISRESLLGNAITVLITERKPFARWCASDMSCYAMDSSGFVFAPASTTPRFGTAYVFEGAIMSGSSPIGQMYLPGRFAGVLTLLERLGQAGMSAERISLEGEQDFSVKLSQGFKIHATFGADVGLLVKNLELILASEALHGRGGEIEYIDLRFGNRVYYKLKGEDQAQQQ